MSVYRTIGPTLVRLYNNIQILTEAVAEVNIIFFLVHITSCTPAEKAINVLLYNQHVYNISTVNHFTPLAVYGTALFLS